MADTQERYALAKLIDEIVDCAVSVGKSDAMKAFGAFTEIDSISMTAMRRSISQKRAQIIGYFDETATPQPADAALVGKLRHQLAQVTDECARLRALSQPAAPVAQVPDVLDISIFEEVTEALAARLGTNAAEWPIVRRAFDVLAAAQSAKGGE